MARDPNSDKFTPTEQRILEILSDGLPHTKEELRGVLWDEMAVASTLSAHLTNIRRVLMRQGQTIICEFVQQPGQFGKKLRYRHVRLLRSPVDGRT